MCWSKNAWTLGHLQGAMEWGQTTNSKEETLSHPLKCSRRCALPSPVSWKNLWVLNSLPISWWILIGKLKLRATSIKTFSTTAFCLFLFFCTFVECITVSAGIRHQLFCFHGMNSWQIVIGFCCRTHPITASCFRLALISSCKKVLQVDSAVMSYTKLMSVLLPTMAWGKSALPL